MVEETVFSAATGAVTIRDPVISPEPDPPTLAELREIASLGKRELLERCVAAEILTLTDATTAIRGEIPPSFAAALSEWTPEQLEMADWEWASNDTIARTNPLIIAAADAKGISDEQLDALFGVAAP